VTRRGTGVWAYVERAGERVTLKIGLELRSPNKTLWAHWRAKQNERQKWEKAITAALAVERNHGDWRFQDGAPKPVPPAPRVRVSATRYVPHRRRFIRDDDNLVFAMKPVLDALKACGLIQDDRRSCCQLETPRQVAGTSPAPWTEIVIEPAYATTATHGA
jgi:hypothetical protein